MLYSELPLISAGGEFAGIENNRRFRFGANSRGLICGQKRNVPIEGLLDLDEAGGDIFDFAIAYRFDEIFDFG